MTAPVQLSGGGNKHENENRAMMGGERGRGRAKVDHMTSLEKKQTNREEWEEHPRLEWNLYFWITFSVFYCSFFFF